MNMPVKSNCELSNITTASQFEVNSPIKLSSDSSSSSSTSQLPLPSSSLPLSSSSTPSMPVSVSNLPAMATSTAVVSSMSVANNQQIGNNSLETKTTNTCDVDRNTSEADSNDATTPGREKRSMGCAHYKRRAMFVTPCCNKFYKCRYCHDENESHHFDRKTLTELICSECDTRQRVQEKCEKCGVRFGKYTCLICNLFDDEDKAQYHCYGCGICRIGGRKNFFHCEVCNMCLPMQLKIEGHRCVENISRSNCPVCLGDIHTSRIPCHIPDCGHLLHKMCFDQLLASGHYVCPTCQTSIIDMTKMWEYLDAQALMMPIPKIYENHYLNIFCNDCHKTSTVKFHFIGLKCFYCGGYNTTQDIKRRRSWAMVTSKDNSSTSA